MKAISFQPITVPLLPPEPVAVPIGWMDASVPSPLRRTSHSAAFFAVPLLPPEPPSATTTDLGWLDTTSRYTRRISQPPGPLVAPPGLPDGMVVVPPPPVPAGCVHMMDHRLVQSTMTDASMVWSVLASPRLSQSGLSSSSLCEG
jgi:hypothetical protein